MKPRLFCFKSTAVHLAVFFFFQTPVIAQSHAPAAAHHGQGHRFTFALGHAHLGKEAEHHMADRYAMSAFVLNYDFLFNENWGLGAHNDVIIEEAPVVHTEGTTETHSLERSFPVAARLVGSYKPGKHTMFMVGIGDEIASHQHHFLTTVGIDYGWELRSGWELGGELTYDFVNHASNNWVVGIGISKVLHVGHHKK